MVENVAPMPRPMRVMAGASSAVLAAVPECATMAASTATPATVTTMPARPRRRPSLVTRFLHATDAMTIRPHNMVAAAITRNTSDLYRYLAEDVGPLPGVQYVET